MKETVAFQVLVLYREFLSYTVKRLKSLGLSFGQMPFILYVGKHPGCMQADLTKKLKLDWGYAQRSIGKLVDSGFMLKKHDREKACNFLELTEAGHQAFDVCHHVFYAFDEMKMNKLSEEEKIILTDCLKKIQDGGKDLL